MNGRYGPYLAYKGKNYRLPKALHSKLDSLTYDDCMKIIDKNND
jgi:DNA topoisomerase-1